MGCDFMRELVMHFHQSENYYLPEAAAEREKLSHKSSSILLVHHLANIALFPHLIIFSAREKGTRPRLSAPKVVQKCVLSHNSLFLWIKVDEKDAWIASKRQKQKFVVVTYIPSAESDQGNVVFVPSLELLACY